MKRKKKEGLYLPLQFVSDLLEDPNAEYFSDVDACDNHFYGLPDVKRYHVKDTKAQRCNISRTAFIAADWNRTKQSYKITKELAGDLFSMDDLTFPAGSINLPYRTIYLDLSDCDLRITREESKTLVIDMILSGIYLTFGTIMVDGLPAIMCGFVTLLTDPRDGSISFGGISFDVTDAVEGNMNLNQFIEESTIGFEEIRDSFRKALLFAAYISSEKPDVEENEEQKKYYRPSTKSKNTSIRKWDVGIRYQREILRRNAINALDDVNSSDHAKGHSGYKLRPHIRKAHWHTYRCGKGRTERKILWVPPVEINCDEKENLPVVVHLKDRAKTG